MRELTAVTRNLLCAALFAAVLSGCCTSPMKSTPFYGGDSLAYYGKVEDRVNLWPLAYWREPALSVAWPVFSKADDHFAFRPLYSQYRQGGSGYDEFNVLWPVCQLDTRHESGRVLPFFWGRGYLAAFPAFWWSQSLFALGPYVTSRERNWGTLFPLAYWDLDRQRYWYAAGLGGYWRRDDFKILHWLIPLYVRNRSGVFSVPYSRVDDGPAFDEYYLCGLGGRKCAPGGCQCSWMFPLFYHDRDGLLSPLYGKTAEADWLMPFYWRNRTDFHTLVWSTRRDEKTGETGGFSLPLLSGARWNTNSCECAWWSLLGLVGARTNASGDRRQQWAIPLYYRDAGRSFASLAYGWSGGRTGRTNEWWAAGLAGVRSGAETGDWVFPFYSRRQDASFDGRLALMDAPGSAKAENFVVRNRRTFLLLSDYDEWVRGTCEAKTNRLAITHGGTLGNWLLYHRDWSEKVAVDLRTRDEVERTASDSSRLFGFLYARDTRRNVCTNETSRRLRVLWKLLDWNEENGNLTVDAFPGYTHDAKTNGYRKTSFLWRLYRNEFDPVRGRAVDVLFLPVWRD